MLGSESARSEALIVPWHRNNEASRRPGIGPITLWRRCSLPVSWHATKSRCCGVFHGVISLRPLLQERGSSLRHLRFRC